MEKNRYEFNISGNNYVLKSDKTESEVRQIVKFVNSELEDAKDILNSKHRTASAILACLNIADSLYDLELKHRNLQDMTKDSLENYEPLKNEFNLLKDRFNQIDSENKEINEKLNSINNDWDGIVNENNHLKGEIDRERNENHRLSEENYYLREDLNRINEEHNKVKKEYDEVNSKYTNYQSEIQQQENILDDIVAENEELQKRIRHLESIIEQAENNRDYY